MISVIKMSRITTSDVWQFFIRRGEQDPVCKFCKQIIKAPGGSTSNLLRHIKIVHKKNVVSSTSNNNCNNNGAIESTGAAATTSYGTSCSIENYFTSSKAIPAKVKESLDRSLIITICKDNLPFNLVESPNFQAFVTHLNPKYSMPSRKTVAKTLLPLLYEEVLQTTMDKLKSAKAISLTTDGWTSCTNTSFIAVTAHFFDEEINLNSLLLECAELAVSHTSVNLAECIEHVLEKFQIKDKIVSLTTDNARNITLAASLLDIKHFSCFAHTLNLIVKHAIDVSIGNIVNEVKHIVMHFKKSSVATHKLVETQKNLKMEELKLKQDVATRWNSTYVMLERFIRNRIPLGVCIEALKIKCNLKTEDWDIIEKSVKILKCFDEATVHVSAEKVATLSKMGLIIRMLRKNLHNFQQTICPMPSEIGLLISSLMEGIAIRFQSLETDPYVTQSMLLDPRFKKSSLENEPDILKTTYEALKDEITPLYECSAPDEPSNSSDIEPDSLFFEFVSKINYADNILNPNLAAQKEIDSYLSTNNIKFSEDPITWWKKEGKNYPKLYNIFLRRFCIPATSVPCERIFSKAGNIFTEKRNRLAPKRLQEILLIQQNYGS
uniref:BED-type domain-containing protein n=1 Tax=Anopheles atroparvus TaxID=41427 RepID=A0AAG5CZ13_ANOAO